MYTELFNPIYGTVDGLPVIVLGAVSLSVGSVTTIEWVVTDDDGMLRKVQISDVVVDVRFREGQWHDTAPGVMDDEA